jgi:hypothetical protein
VVVRWRSPRVACTLRHTAVDVCMALGGGWICGPVVGVAAPGDA